MNKLAARLVAVVDDEEAIRKALQRLLRSAGFDVMTFASGPEFLRSLSARRPDCLVLDIRMQGMTGFDVQTRLKDDATKAGDAAPPVVFITALDDPNDEQRALKAGAAGFLRKPFGDQDLLAAIDGAIGSALKTTDA